MELEAPPFKHDAFDYNWRAWMKQVYEKFRGPNWMIDTFYIRDAATGANAPTLSAFGPSSVGIAYEFNRTDIAYGDLQLPLNIKPNSQIFLSVHWTANATSGGNVEWVLNYSQASVDGVFSTPQSVSLVDPVSSTAWTHQTIMTPTGIDIDGTGKIFLGSVARGNTSDTYSNTGQGNVWAFAVDIHYQVDRLGSANRSYDYYKRTN